MSEETPPSASQDECREALVALARLTPSLAETAHSTAPEHAAVQELLRQNMVSQQALSRKQDEIEGQLTERLELEASLHERGAHVLAALEAQTRSITGTATHVKSPTMTELIAKVAARERVLEMHRLMARELVLSAGADWRDPALQRIVVSLPASAAAAAQDVCMVGKINGHM
jgi:hypothetical protein